MVPTSVQRIGRCSNDVSANGFEPRSRFPSDHFKNFTDENRSGRRGSNSQLSAWEAEFSILYFQYLQNHLEKMYVHALHTVHALPDLRVAAGRLRDGVSPDLTLSSKSVKHRVFGSQRSGEARSLAAYEIGGSASRGFRPHGLPKRWRYSIDSIKALTISAAK